LSFRFCPSIPTDDNNDTKINRDGPIFISYG
jgi:hypothetical protein